MSILYWDYFEPIFHSILAIVLFLVLCFMYRKIDAIRHKGETKEERIKRKENSRKKREETEKQINWQLRCWGLQLLIVIGVSLLIASIIKLDISLNF